MGCSGRVALVTGASGGIGAAVALALHRAGACVALSYHSRRDSAAQVQERIRSEGGEALLFQADLTKADAARTLVRVVEAECGRLDILVNNAGARFEGLLIDTPVAEWDRLVALHMRAPFVCSQTALPGMMQRMFGRIINIVSMWGQVGAANEVAYSAVKAGLIGFTKALAKEVGSAGVTVNAVSPGVIVTDMLSGFDEEEIEALRSETPVMRLGRPEDVARAVTFLADDAADFITGQVVAVNGGFVT